MAGIPSQQGRVAVVTGGAGGLGFEVALALACNGADVTLAGRDEAKGERAAGRIAEAAPGVRVRFSQLDLADLQSIAKFATAMREELPSLDVLVANAGLMAPAERMTTRDGFELQFGVNYLGHFALTAGLMPPLLKSAAPRVVSVTSAAHRHVRLDLDDLQTERGYQTGLAYARSKLAQAVFAQELQRRSDAGGWGIVSVAAHPGVARTSILDPGDGGRRSPTAIGTGWLAALVGQTAAAGAASIVHAAVADGVRGGELYGPGGPFEIRGAPLRGRLAAQALDPGLGAMLWRKSEELCGISHDGSLAWPSA